MVVSFKDISKQYGKTSVLNQINLDVENHKITALVGESGSGKTTLLQLVNGLTEPSSGHVELFGDKLNYDDISGMRKKMGYAVQGGGLFPHMSVYENIIVMAKLDGWSDADIKKRVDHVIKLVNLYEELLDRYPHKLSGGQQQRVSLCRALMLDPALLLLDEPFSALDPITKEHIHDEFLKMQQAEPRAIMLVSHDMSEAVKLADNIVIIEKGEIIQQGKTADIIQNPANDYVRNLLKSHAD
ncbi:ATP-binding cassette domain-containing protein [Pseudemcibacter aquimaris]|uniref:ATP-binding cassette domain-containing protein n=1 Tax=Pseudemcibacter aquimaris TaxID=2857064 RepID=UPI002012E261|nr:ATP-binding cassette domain-containing protein [Pseudemcibacter aquimaris]MCC3861274.1 ATP-binding cassette domain-containing protein [Pseudemcibacter aquimaris]WDU58048.1 ATP-binding cassette domain-containing protein [Pseudemcibacter aquimaris]